MDEKNVVERPHDPKKRRESTSTDHDPVAIIGIHETLRKNNTVPTELGTVPPPSRNGEAIQMKTRTDNTSSLTPDACKTPTDDNVPDTVPGGKTLGTELINKQVTSHDNQGVELTEDNSSRGKEPKSPPKTMNPTGITNVDSGNDQVTIEQTAAARSLAQTATQEGSLLMSSSAGKIPLVQKTVSFSSNIDVSASKMESKETRRHFPSGDSHSPPSVESAEQMPLNPHKNVHRPPGLRGPGSVDAMPVLQTEATASGTSAALSFDETIQRLRAPLVEAYSPFIAPTDTSLSDARDRLKTAINQSRRLRMAFTDRVYQKYRILLRPVQPSTESIIERIKANPAEVSAKLEEEIRLVKEEKEIEKKEAQKLHAAVAANTAADGTLLNTGINAQETAEQLAWFGAGLNIVILPEEDIDDEIDLCEYAIRGPTNPETGQRVSGISAAAASAAEGLLDRVRRGGVMRMERQRRRQLQLLSGEDTEAETDSSSILSHLHLLSSSSTGRTDIGTSTSIVASSPKTLKRGAGTSRGSPHHAASKASRARSQMSLTGSNLLSLNPQAEELTRNGEPSTAATAALLSRGTCSASNSTTIQQRWRHPHPESQGGQRLALTTQSSNRKQDSNRAAVAPMAMSEYIALALPPLPTAKERREKKPLDVYNDRSAMTERGRNAVQCVLEQFFTSNESSDPLLSTSSLPQGSDSTPDISENRQGGNGEEDATPRKEKNTNEAMPTDPVTETKRKKRHVTEIGLLRGMQQTREQADAKVLDTVTIPTIHAPNACEISSVGLRTDTASGGLLASMSEGQAIDPIVAFSVLHALGLIHEAKSKSSQDLDDVHVSHVLREAESRATILENEKLNSAKEKFTHALYAHPTLTVANPKLQSRKRPFSEAFSLSLSGGTSKKQVVAGEWENPTEVSIMDVDQSSGLGQADIASIRGGGQIIVESTSVNMLTPAHALEEKNLSDDPEAVVPSIRGGGRALGDSSSDGSPGLPENQEEPTVSQGVASIETQTDPNLGNSSTQEVWGESPGSGLPSHLTSLSRSTSSPASFSPSRNAAANGLRMQRPHSSSPSRSVSHTMVGHLERFHPSRVQPVPLSQSALHHQPGATMSRPFAPGELPEYFGGIQPHGGFMSPQNEWSSLGAAAAGLLPTQSSLAALGLNQHRAAMVNMSVRERAARVLLAREQAAAAHAAVRGGASVSSLSPQQAAVLMGAPPSHANTGLYQATTQNVAFGHLGPPSVASTRGILSSPANSPLLGIDAASPGSGPVTQRKQTRNARLPQKPAGVTGKIDKNVPGARDIDEFHLDSSDPKRQNGVPKDRANNRSAAALPQHLNKNLAGSEGEEIITGMPKDTVGARSQQTPGSSSSLAHVASSNIPTESSPRNAAPDGNVAEASLGSAQEATEKSSVASSTSDEQEEIPSSLQTTGMVFCAPPRPTHLSQEMADYVEKSKIHVAYSEFSGSEKPKQERPLSHEASSLIEYLLALGAAVPIPKALVSSPLKERLNTPGFKNPGNGGSPTIPREVVIAAILVWLWAQHNDSFQRAFAKSGRIDVDPECKWLILAAVDAAVRALMFEIADSVARGGPLAAALSSNRNKPASSALKSTTPVAEKDFDRLPGSFTKLDIQVASIVSEALMTELCINEDMDVALPHFEELVKQLDECRLSSLRAKSRERALLAALISRRATMSEPFSHAYVSSMVRSGEALGHEELFEVVQDEKTSTSTKIPYDIFSDDAGAWEDPCRVTAGFTPALTGDDLTRRAHARAMIQKSLKKLQDRHNIRGGTPNAGPYTDPPATANTGGAGGSPVGATDGKSIPALQRTNSGLKRKSSFSHGTDTPVSAGSGSAAATSLDLYRPNHHSAPLIFDCDAVENLPYGRHSLRLRKRSLSLGRVGYSTGLQSGGKSGRKSRLSRSTKATMPSDSPSSVDSSSNTPGLQRSTEEIPWNDVAEIFEPVSLSAPMTPTAKKAAGHHAPVAVVPGKTIIAPFCRRIDDLPEDSSSDDDSEDEDLSDSAVLARHQVVLEGMKTKLEKYMQARQKAKQRGARRSSSKLK